MVASCPSENARLWLSALCVTVMVLAQISGFRGTATLAASSKEEDAEFLVYDGNGNHIGLLGKGTILPLDLNSNLWVSGTCCAHRATPSLSQDGAEIAFVSLSSSQPRGEVVSIYDLHDRKQRQVFEAEAIWSVSWAPDGTRLALVADRVSDRGRNLYIVGLPSGQVSLLDHAHLQLDAGYSVSNRAAPSWSSDGKRVALEIQNANKVMGSEGSSSIGVWQIETNQFHNLADGLDPAWSPASDTIAFLSLSRRMCFTMKSDGSDRRTLFSLGKRPFGPDTSPLLYPVVWSPDGTQLIFQQWADADLLSDVYKLDLKSGNVKLLSRTDVEVVNWRKAEPSSHECASRTMASSRARLLPPTSWSRLARPSSCVHE